MKYLVIVESPAKIQKIQTYLNSIGGGNTFVVAASMGHIRKFADGLKSIDIDNDYNASYSIIGGKSNVVKDLKSKSKSVDEVIIATDPDREGEAIGFHLVNVLGLEPASTKRMTFNEISKPAIVQAFNNIHRLDENLYEAQEARSILDLLIGFKVSPVLWKCVQPKLSAGRCQSPALRLVYERELEIKQFKSNSYFSLNAIFNYLPDIEAEYKGDEFKDVNEIVELMPKLVKLSYELVKQESRVHSHNPPAPYITSSIQQDSSNKLGMSPKNTMGVLQKLYERGVITYMRTDSTSISHNFQKEIEKWVNANHSNMYNKREYKKKVANAQEAHECIRPVDVNVRNLESSFSSQEKKLYNMIWTRTVASQMKQCVSESTQYIWKSEGKKKYTFSFTLSRDIDLGYKVIYPNKDRDDTAIINKIASAKSPIVDTPMSLKAMEKFTKPPSRYSEASLIKALEDLGIGRPSTYSSIITTLLERMYVIKDGDYVEKRAVREYTITNKDNKVVEKVGETTISSEKNKLVLTPMGEQVCQFMNKNFECIQSYDLTKDIEEELDDIASGNKSKTHVIDKMYKLFNPTVEKFMSQASKIDKKTKTENDMSRHKLLGKHPQSQKNIYLYFGRFGPCIAVENGLDDFQFASIPKDIQNSVISLDDALKLLEFPKVLGKHAGHNVILKTGPYGAYVEWDKTRVSLSKIGKTIHNVKLEDIIEVLDSGEHSMTTLKEYTDGMKIMQNANGVFVKKADKMVRIPDEQEWDKLKKTDFTKLLAEYVPSKRKFFKKRI